MRKKATLLLLGILTITLLLFTGCSERKDYPMTVSVLGHLEEGKYTGTVKKGLAEGAGHFLSNTSEWDGTFSESVLKEGTIIKGTFELPIGIEKISATIENGKMSDGSVKGVFSTENGSYEGCFDGKKIIGEGTADALVITLDLMGEHRVGIYTGPMLNGLPEGENGSFKTTDDLPEMTYEGGWKEGVFDGDGEITADQFEIAFSDAGRKVPKSGSFSGSVKNGVANGEGTFSAENADGVKYTYNGNFNSGMFSGQGKVEYESGEVLQGRFKAGNFSPSMGDFFRALGTYFTPKFNFQDENVEYIDNHQQNFKFFSGDRDYLWNFDLDKFKKDPSNYESGLVGIDDLYVVQVFSKEAWGIKYEQLILQTFNGNNTFYVFAYGSTDITEGDQVDICIMPIDYTTYKNVNNNDVWATFGVLSAYRFN